MHPRIRKMRLYIKDQHSHKETGS